MGFQQNGGFQVPKVWGFLNWNGFLCCLNTSKKYYLSIYFAGAVSGILEPTPNKSHYCTILIPAIAVASHKYYTKMWFITKSKWIPQGYMRCNLQQNEFLVFQENLGYTSYFSFVYDKLLFSFSIWELADSIFMRNTKYKRQKYLNRGHITEVWGFFHQWQNLHIGQLI